MRLMHIQALVLLKLEQGEWLGLIVGGVVSGLLLALNIKRSFDTSKFSCCHQALGSNLKQ